MIIWLAGLALCVTGQNRLSVDTGGYALPDFIREDANVLRGNRGALKPFLQKLYRLKKYGDVQEQKIRIVHIGDSHLQAGYLNGTVMRRFQADFGNAGRGLVVPLKLSSTNEPIDYDIVSDIRWEAARCLSSRPRYPVGIGGISIVPRDTVFHLEVQISATEAEKYRFNRVDVYHLPGSAELRPQEKGVQVGESPWPFITRYDITRPVAHLSFEGHARNKDSCVYYGFSLENGQNGILYHTIGINGAQYTHYRNVDRFMEQVQSLQPDLVIFSLGTNEAFRGYFSEAFIRKEMDAVVLQVKRTNPDAVIILTTPAECQWKVKRKSGKVYEPNPYISPIAETIVEYAREHGFVYWDLLGMSGGAGSSEKWIEGDYLSRDRIHFAVSGYRLQGNMLYNALMKEYNRYVDACSQKLQADDWWKVVSFPKWGRMDVPAEKQK